MSVIATRRIAASQPSTQKIYLGWTKLTSWTNRNFPIAGKIATALRVEISAAERERLYRRYTANPAAYELYLKGRAELARLTRESTLAAVDAFESALRQDPNYALAHAGLAMSCALMRLRYASEGEVANWEERAHPRKPRCCQSDRSNDQK